MRADLVVNNSVVCMFESIVIVNICKKCLGHMQRIWGLEQVQIQLILFIIVFNRYLI
jgi:hypothetical protein